MKIPDSGYLACRREFNDSIVIAMIALKATCNQKRSLLSRYLACLDGDHPFAATNASKAKFLVDFGEATKRFFVYNKKIAEQSYSISHAFKLVRNYVKVK